MNNKLTEEELHIVWDFSQDILGLPGNDIDQKWLISMVEEIRYHRNAPRMTFMKDDDGHWYSLLVTEMEEFAETSIDELEERWGNKRLEMHPTNYTFIDLRVE